MYVENANRASILDRINPDMMPEARDMQLQRGNQVKVRENQRELIMCCKIRVNSIS